MIHKDMISTVTTAIGLSIRVRIPVDKGRESETARYEDTTVTGWKIRKDMVPVESDGDHEFDPDMKLVDTPLWHCKTTVGQEIWLTGHELLEALCRFLRKKNHDDSYFEADASFLAYRNSLGRHCGKAAEAGQAFTPLRFAQFMVRREAELYQLLKHLVYESSSWFGRDGQRSHWVNSMKDYAFEFETARDGLLTLEKALFEMMGGDPAASPVPSSAGSSDNQHPEAGLPSGKALLENPSTREDIELESLEKGIKGLWNSRSSRAVFLEIVTTCRTVGFLVLGLELLVRNAMAYISANTTTTTTTTMTSKGSTGTALISEAEWTPYDLGTAPRSSRRAAATTTTSSRTNNNNSYGGWYDDSYGGNRSSSHYYMDDEAPRTSRRANRVNYAGLD